MAQIFKGPKRQARKKQQSQQAKQKLVVDIDGMDHMGQGVCRGHSPVIFVEGAIAGEQCEIEIVNRQSRVWQARATQILRPHNQRQTPPCQHFAECGGCQTQHLQSDAMLSAKQTAVSGLITRMTGASQLPWQAPLSGSAQGYRRKVRLAIDARDPNRPVLGFRAKGSKAIVPISHCIVLRAPLVQLLSPLNVLLQSLQHPQRLGHITLFEGDQRCLVAVRIVKPLSQSDRQTWLQFQASQNCDLVLQDKQGDEKPLGNSNSVSRFSPAEGLYLENHADDFVQVNDEINREMVAQALQWLAVSPDDQVLDLFCGLGNFSLPLARQCQQVIGVEGSANMVQRADANAQNNSMNNVSFWCANINDAENNRQSDWFNAAAACNKVLLDPARDGAAQAMPLLLRLAPSHILYVSCNPATFARDSKTLLSNDYQLEKLGLMDMFPYTAHTELMALFVRNSS